MAFFNLPNLQNHLLHKTSFLGLGVITHNLSSQHHHQLQERRRRKMSSSLSLITTASKFDLFSIMGGRGLCNGEKSLQEELNKPVDEAAAGTSSNDDDDDEEQESLVVPAAVVLQAPEDAFDKELLGLTGGFPGGEIGLRSFIEKNPPPPPPPSKKSSTVVVAAGTESSTNKLKPPELPILMPGMIAIVKNPKNPFYNYCGIIQRITDGKAGVLFEGGNWDKLLTFQLSELERRDKGPPMVNPKSAELESLVDRQKQSSS